MWIFAGINSYLYTQQFKNAVLDSVQTIDVPINPDIFSIPQSVTIAVGVLGSGATVDSDNDFIYLDNIQLFLGCLAKPSQVSLVFADANNLSNSMSVQDLGLEMVKLG